MFLITPKKTFTFKHIKNCTKSCFKDRKIVDENNLKSEYYYNRGVINGKAGKAAALPKFLDTLTLSQSGGEGQIMPNYLLCLT